MADVTHRPGDRAARAGRTIAQAALSRVEHRPWPLPGGPWILRQQWHDLLFIHWRASVAALRPLVPRALTIQEFDGSSWVGIVPFQILGLSPRFVPDLPLVSSFPELNLRLYVEAAGKPGVWFVSLDAASAAAVAGARAAFRLPYHHARMSHVVAAGAVRFRHARTFDPAIRFESDYMPTGPEYEAPAGTLDHFLTERYCLYTRGHLGGVRRMDIQHPPWRLRRARAQIVENTLAARQGIKLDLGGPPLLHFSERQDVLAWRPESV